MNYIAIHEVEWGWDISRLEDYGFERDYLSTEWDMYSCGVIRGENRYKLTLGLTLEPGSVLGVAGPEREIAKQLIGEVEESLGMILVRIEDEKEVQEAQRKTVEDVFFQDSGNEDSN